MKVFEILKESDAPAWYIVKTDDTIGAGPFDTKPTDSKLQTFAWYIKDRHSYSVEFGTVDDDDKFVEAKKAVAESS